MQKIENFLENHPDIENFERTFFAPNIPSKKLQNAINKYASEIAPKDVLILLDETVLGSAKEGLLVTEDVIYCKSIGQKIKAVKLKDIAEISHQSKFTGRFLCINNENFIPISQAKQNEVETLIKFIEKICNIETTIAVDENDSSINKETSSPSSSKIVKFGGGFLVAMVLLAIYGAIFDPFGTRDTEEDSAIVTEEQKEIIYSDIHKIGKQIAYGICFNQLENMKDKDPNIEYQILTNQDSFTAQENTWPVVDTTIQIDSQVYGKSELSFLLLLEISKKNGTVVGTIKNIKFNGNENNKWNHLENSMFIDRTEFSDGIVEVRIVNGKLEKK